MRRRLWQKVNYEGQAAIEFEALADPAEAGMYSFGVESGLVGVRGVVEALVKDAAAGIPIQKISARFHNGLAEYHTNWTNFGTIEERWFQSIHT